VAILSRRVWVAFAALTVLVAGGAPAQAAGAGVGAPAPAFTLPDWQGRSRALAEFRGKLVVVDFWASWCTPCATALPALDTLARHYAPGDVVVLAVDIDTAREQAERFLAERIPQPAIVLLRDPGGKILARYGAEGMPALYLLDRDGVVRRVEAGYAPERITSVAASIDALLAHDAATPSAATTSP
jgi:thiol-disulfide isomerase/thioredoxin